MRGLTHWLVNYLGELAFTLLGVDFNERTGEARFLIMVAHPRRGIRISCVPTSARETRTPVSSAVFSCMHCLPLSVVLTRCSDRNTVGVFTAKDPHTHTHKHTPLTHAHWALHI